MLGNRLILALHTDNFIWTTSNRLPFLLPVRPIPTTDYLRQRIATSNSVEKAKSIANITLSGGVGPDKDGEGAKPERYVSETLEICEAD